METTASLMIKCSVWKPRERAPVFHTEHYISQIKICLRLQPLDKKRIKREQRENLFYSAEREVFSRRQKVRVSPSKNRFTAFRLTKKRLRLCTTTDAVETIIHRGYIFCWMERSEMFFEERSSTFLLGPGEIVDRFATTEALASQRSVLKEPLSARSAGVDVGMAVKNLFL